MIQLVTCTPDVWLPVTIYSNLITFLVDEIYYKHWKGSEHCIGFVSHCSSLILSLCALSAVMTLICLNSGADRLGFEAPCPAILLLNKAKSSSVQDLYLMFSKAVLNLASSRVCVFCLIFCLKITTTVN